MDAISNVSAHLFRTCLVCVSAGLPCISIGSTSVDICQDPVAESHLSIAYYDHESSSFESNLGETNRESYSTDLLFQENNKWRFGGGHRSVILNDDRLELQTNGYLHTFFFAAHRLIQTDSKSFRFSIAPTLSGSSNVVKDPDQYTADALQLLAVLVWNRRIADRLELRYGICGDHRFGEYQIYPVIGVKWQLHRDWIFDFGFPASQLTHLVTKSLASSLRIVPSGNEWYVKDKSLEKQSDFVYEAYLLELAFNWRAHENYMLTASVGREFHSRYEMTLRDESRVRLTSDPATRVGVDFAWIF